MASVVLVVRELGVERRETVRFLSIVGVKGRTVTNRVNKKNS